MCEVQRLVRAGAAFSSAWVVLSAVFVSVRLCPAAHGYIFVYRHSKQKGMQRCSSKLDNAVYLSSVFIGC